MTGALPIRAIDDLYKSKGDRIHDPLYRLMKRLDINRWSPGNHPDGEAARYHLQL